MGGRTIVIGRGVVRIELQRLIIVRNRLIVPAGERMDHTALGVGVSKLRVDADCFAEVLERARMLVLGAINVAAIVKGNGKMRREANGLRIVGGRLVKAAETLINEAAIEVGQSVFGISSGWPRYNRQWRAPAGPC